MDTLATINPTALQFLLTGEMALPTRAARVFCSLSVLSFTSTYPLQDRHELTYTVLQQSQRASAGTLVLLPKHDVVFSLGYAVQSPHYYFGSC